MNRRILRAWCLYDFGNSAFAVLFPFVFGTYYAHTVVGGARGSALWGYAGSLSMLCVALSAPLLGGIADHAGARKRMLLLFTAVGLGTVLGFDAVGPGTVAAGFVLAIAANFAFEGGIVFYNAYLPLIAPPSHHGRVSAYGFATGYVGSLVAIGVAVLLARTLGVAWIWPALALQWGLFALPAFLRLPADRPTGMGLLASGKRGVKRTLFTWREVAGMPDLRRFLLAYFFYMD